ncbi:MAG: hypothetical protein ACOC1K_03135 [Nanoarchaeota archaeon]
MDRLWYYVFLEDKDMYKLRNHLLGWFQKVDKLFVACKYFNAEGFYSCSYPTGFLFNSKPANWTRVKYIAHKAYRPYYNHPEKWIYDAIIQNTGLLQIVWSFEERYNIKIHFSNCITGFTRIGNRYAFIIPVRKFKTDKGVPHLNYYKKIFPHSEFILTSKIENKHTDNLDYWNWIEGPMNFKYKINTFNRRTDKYRQELINMKI